MTGSAQRARQEDGGVGFCSRQQHESAGEEHEVTAVESDSALTLGTEHVAGATDVAIERLVPQEAPAEPAAPPDPAPADDEPAAKSLDDRIAAAVDEQLVKALAPMQVERDLEALADSVPPVALKEARAMLTRAATEGRMDDYRATIRMLGSSDASALLAAPRATAGKTGTAHTVPGMSQEDIAWLEDVGIEAEAAAKAVRKYMNKAK